MDDFVDLLDPLPIHRRWGLIAYLSVRYYEEWLPSRPEVTDLVSLDLGAITVDEYVERRRRRQGAHNIPNP